MSETPQEGQQEPSKEPQTLEGLLADLDEDRRKVILGQVEKSRKEARSLRGRVKELEPLAAAAQQAEQAQKTAEEVAEERAKQAEERMRQATARAVRSEVRALAATDFADPDDAAAFLNLPDYMDDAGDVDTDQIRRDLADLLKRKPHLGRATPGERRPPAPDRSQASSANGATAADPASQFASILRSQFPGAR